MPLHCRSRKNRHPRVHAKAFSKTRVLPGDAFLQGHGLHILASTFCTLRLSRYVSNNHGSASHLLRDGCRCRSEFRSVGLKSKAHDPLTLQRHLSSLSRARRAPTGNANDGRVEVRGHARDEFFNRRCRANILTKDGNSMIQHKESSELRPYYSIQVYYWEQW